MSSDYLDRLLPAAISGKGWSRVRPLTLLVACGIVLAAALLIVTGVVVGYLRQQTLTQSEAAIGQLDGVLAEAAGRPFQIADRLLDDIARRLLVADSASPDEAARRMAAPEVAPLLARRIEAAPLVGGLALIGADGTVLNRAGGWPRGERDVATRDYFIALRAEPALELAIGAGLAADAAPSAADRQAGLAIPVARKLRDAQGNFAGAAVAALPAAAFADFYRAVPLDQDEMIALMRRDGAVLTHYPIAADATADAGLAASLRDGAHAIVENLRGAGGRRIAALQPVAGYPVAVIVSRGEEEALTGWSRQAEMFGAFAVCGVLTIALMVFLIGRQMHTHNVLAAIRAEKIEMEHARLVAEAELLKKERLSVLGQFTATVANELRNPLSAIRNTLFTMREIATSSGLTLDRPIARIQRSIGRCDRIIGDLLEYIRSPELSRVAVSFDQWLHDVLAEHNLPPAVTLVEDYRAGDAIVRIDADRIRRVVINLIDNGAQALGEMPPGAASPLCITVRSAIVDGSLALQVADNGPGIPSETMARIFEPLFSTKSFGAGLGLATVKQIVVQHGGTIEIDSNVGGGTCVTICLPLEQGMRAAA
ncbi:MAG TPA: ATP-binding protein [Stellaceae bacterium]|nr:ATP-binding protein [Stellaceae bacterium]